MAATIDLHLKRRVEALIAQQLPELHKLEGLYAVYSFTEEPNTGVSQSAHNVPHFREFHDNYMELCEKLQELLSTEYARDLILILLPTLIEIKKHGSEAP